MFLRFQKERVKKARNVSLFNLDGGDNVLTHKGEILLFFVGRQTQYVVTNWIFPSISVL